VLARRDDPPEPPRRPDHHAAVSARRPQLSRLRGSCRR
jgi:hypothetical protein